MTVDARGIKATFERDGVYLARGVFDAATIDRLAADFDRIVALPTPTYDPERHMAFQN